MEKCERPSFLVGYCDACCCFLLYNTHLVWFVRDHFDAASACLRHYRLKYWANRYLAKERFECLKYYLTRTSFI